MILIVMVSVFWRTSDNSAYLRALMHADGNIRYANYQNEQQMTQYLTDNGFDELQSQRLSLNWKTSGRTVVYLKSLCMPMKYPICKLSKTNSVE